MDRNGTGLKLICIGLLVGVLLSTVCYAAKKNQDPPKFFVHHKDVNVGEVYEGQNITYAYKVRNNGNGELHIINVKPG